MKGGPGAWAPVTLVRDLEALPLAWPSISKVDNWEVSQQMETLVLTFK